MENINKLGLEYKKRVNNSFNNKLIYNNYHSISKDSMINAYKNFTMVDYIGFDTESLEFYENWLGGDIGRY